MVEKDENIVFFGKKPYGVYVHALMTSIEKVGFVVFKTRGKNIPGAINIADFLTREKKVKIESVTIGTDTYEFEGKEKRSPEIEIKLKK